MQVDQDGSVDCVASHYRLPGEDDGALWEPPVRNFMGWVDPQANYYLSFDYAGLGNAWLEANGMSVGTTTTGSINERPLPNGGAEVCVILHTHNALAWVVPTGIPDLLFGHFTLDVLAGSDAALGDCTLQLTFINTAPGAPLPDLMQLVLCPEDGQVPLTLSFVGQARGTFRAAAGVPDGTPGFVGTRQTGLLRVAGTADAHSRVARDAFPAESIRLQPIGK